LGVVVGVRVDEAGGQYEAVEVDGCGIGRREVADLGNAPIAYGDIGPSRCRAGPVDDRCATKHEIHDASPGTADA